MTTYRIAESSGLWLPDDLADLLSVFPGDDPDEDTKKGADQINQAGEDWISGKIDGDVYFDLLAQNHLDPCKFIGEIYDHFHLLSLRL